MTALWRASPFDSGGWERCRWDGGFYNDDEVRGRPADFHDPVMRHGDGVFASGACRLELSLRSVGPVERLTGGGLAVGLAAIMRPRRRRQRVASGGRRSGC